MCVEQCLKGRRKAGLIVAKEKELVGRGAAELRARREGQDHGVLPDVELLFKPLYESRAGSGHVHLHEGDFVGVKEVDDAVGPHGLEALASAAAGRGEEHDQPLRVVGIRGDEGVAARHSDGQLFLADGNYTVLFCRWWWWCCHGVDLNRMY